MNLIARARRLFAPNRARRVRAELDDPAGMGTAFGLDATTTLQPQAWEAWEGEARQRAAALSRMQTRVHRRSSF